MGLVTTKYGTVQDPDLKIRISKAITESAESSPELRKEINKLFKQANTRINRLKDSGLYKVSPAYQALGSMTDGAHSRFAGRTYFTQNVYFDDGSTATKDWEEVKDEYKRAVAFLNNESSQVAGAKAVERTLRQSTENYLGRRLPDNVWEKVKDNWVDDIGYVDERLLASGYTHFMERFNDYVSATEEQMVRDAEEAERMLQESIQQQSDQLAGVVVNDILGPFLE